MTVAGNSRSTASALSVVVVGVAVVRGSVDVGVGDDLVDLEALRSVGLSISVSDGHAAVTQEVDWVTDAAGGKGAVREIADAILESQGKAGRVVAKAGG